MEGLIPFLIHAMKRQKLHQHSFRCLSDGSRRSYHLLGSAGDSFNGSSHHRRTQSEFVPPASMDVRPEVEEFVRSRSFKSTNYNNYNDNNNNNNQYGLRKTPNSGGGLATQGYNDYSHGRNKHGSKGMKKSHHN